MLEQPNLTTGSERSGWTRLLHWVPFQVLVFAVLTRLMMAFGNWYVLRLVPPPWQEGPKSILGWAQWDAAHYARIVLNGYDHPTDPGSTAFFPLYPLIVRGVATVLGMMSTTADVLVVGVLVAGGFFLVSVVLVTWLFRTLCDDEVARTAGVLYCVSPFSFFLTAGYTESLFMVLVASVFLLGHYRKWGWAAGAVALATASRAPGVFLIPVLLLMAWRHRESIRTLATIVIISPLGLLSYMAYTWVVLGDPLAFLSAQEGWGGFYDRTGIYIEGFLDHPVNWFFGDDSSPIMLLNFTLLVVWALTLIPMKRLVGLEMTLFSALIMLQGSFSLHSLGRYLLPAIGTYVVIAVLLTKYRFSPIVRDIVVVSSVVLMTALLILFSQAEWVV